MASIEATAFKRQRSLDRIAAALGISFVYIHGDPVHRHACYLEQVADRLDEPEIQKLLRGAGIAQDAPVPHHINESVTAVATKAVPIEAAAPPLPKLPAGIRIIGHGGGYVLYKEPESFCGPSGEWRQQASYMDQFDTEYQAAAFAAQPQKEQHNARRNKQTTNA